jgi:hypothetical protein
MLTQVAYFKSRLLKLISEDVERLLETVSSGSPVDYAAYQRVVGQIEGLRSALELCEVAEKLIEREV